MWSDSLRDAERAWLLTLLAWGGLSVLSGSAVYVLFTLRARGSELLRCFAAQCAAWGALEMIVAGAMLATLTYRDHAGAVAFHDASKIGVGLAGVIIVVGGFLTLTSVRRGDREGRLGAGIAMVVQGSALLLLVLQLLAITGAAVRGYLLS